jgi:hypothetical protein
MPGRNCVTASVKIEAKRLSQSPFELQVHPARVFATNGGKIDNQAPHDNRGSLGS